MVTLHFASEISILVLHLRHTPQPSMFGLLDAFIRHYLNEMLPLDVMLCLFALFFLYLINFTTMSVLMICQ